MAVEVPLSRAHKTSPSVTSGMEDIRQLVCVEAES